MNLRPLPLAIAVLVLAVAGAALWFVLSRPVPEGPSGAATSTPGGIEAEKRYVEDQGPYHEIRAAYPSLAPLPGSSGAAAAAALKFFAEQETARFKDLTRSLTAEDIRVQALGGERKYVLDMDYEVRESADTISYVYHMYADTLGAHPNAYYRTFTFDKRSGEGLHLDDLFEEGYLDVLSQKSRSMLRAQIAEASGIPEEEYDGSMIDAGTTPFPDNFGNFYLEGDAFVIVFPPYQVGPWAIGTQEARIPRAELSSVLKAEYR